MGYDSRSSAHYRYVLITPDLLTFTILRNLSGKINHNGFSEVKGMSTMELSSYIWIIPVMPKQRTVKIWLDVQYTLKATASRLVNTWILMMRRQLWTWTCPIIRDFELSGFQIRWVYCINLIIINLDRTLYAWTICIVASRHWALRYFKYF